MTIYFTSDLHIGHKNVITLCNRPFSSVEEMNEGLINNFNSKVSAGDTTYFLGDVALCKPEEAIKYLSRMNGQKILIAGNHDKSCLKSAEFKKCFSFIKDLYELSVEDEVME